VHGRFLGAGAGSVGQALVQQLRRVDLVRMPEALRLTVGR
jgi:hypothetical protein